MKQEVKIGQTDYTVLILIRDTAGAAKTGLTNASAGIDVCYTRVETDNDVVLTAGAPVALATPALTDVHLDWGFLQVDATNAPGLYRLDIADGVFAAGAWAAVVSLIATGIDPVHIEFVLVPVDPYTGVNVSTIGGTAQTANDNGADINDILVDTAVIGALGAGLTALATQTSVDGIETHVHTTIPALLPAALGADGFIKASLFGAMGTALTETATKIAGAMVKLFDVTTPVLTCASVNQGGDAHVHADAIDTLTKASGPGDLAAILLDTGTDGVVIPAAQKTGFALSATGADLVGCDVATVGAAPTTLINKVQAIWNRLFTNKTVIAALETSKEKDNATTMETWTLADDDTTASRAV